MGTLKHIVDTNSKTRFTFNEDGSKIRASQGHSIPVDLDYKEQQPPETLFHGTVEKLLPQILEQGLKKMERHHVHLTADETTATKVGERRGKPVILTINAGEMFLKGYSFYLSANGVWLTHAVPKEFIEK